MNSSVLEGGGERRALGGLSCVSMEKKEKKRHERDERRKAEGGVQARLQGRLRPQARCPPGETGATGGICLREFLAFSQLSLRLLTAIVIARCLHRCPPWPLIRACSSPWLVDELPQLLSRDASPSRLRSESPPRTSATRRPLYTNVAVSSRAPPQLHPDLSSNRIPRLAISKSYGPSNLLSPP